MYSRVNDTQLSVIFTQLFIYYLYSYIIFRKYYNIV